VSVERVVRSNGEVVWRVRWREGQRNRSKVLGRKRDAEAFDAEVRHRRRTGELRFLDAGSETLAEYVEGTWAATHAAHLAPKTRQTYAWVYDMHIAPRLGGVKLRDLDPELIARFQAELVADQVGPEARRKAMVLLGGILQRAAEARRIAYNPARLVRKAPIPQREEARPLAPATIEALRQAVDRRDATVIAILAYAGLRPQELRALRWAHVRDRTLLVNAEKTRTRRTVRLLAPLATDLAEWRLASGRPPEDAPVIPGQDGRSWTAEGFNKWRQRTFAAALKAAGVAHARPYDLRHSFASLLLHEGRSVIYVARQLGHGANLTMSTYGHVIDELEDAPRLSAEDAIRQAREQLRTRLVPLASGQ
jgi:integrase